MPFVYLCAVAALTGYCALYAGRSFKMRRMRDGAGCAALAILAAAALACTIIFSA